MTHWTFHSASPNFKVIAYSFCWRERKRKYVSQWQTARSKWKWTMIATVPDLCPTTVKILTHLISRYHLAFFVKHAQRLYFEEFSFAHSHPFFVIKYKHRLNFNMFNRYKKCNFIEQCLIFCTDPDPDSSINRLKVKKKLIVYSLWLLNKPVPYGYLIFEEKNLFFYVILKARVLKKKSRCLICNPGPDPYQKVTDPEH